ncbi:MAG: DUF1156 domain-containing protein [Firmicutes bacterium]|nr:DUF1156 domain-containing protein [Bacillota bacterium]
MGKKLIEVALPLEAINREAAREKSIRRGHPSTLHLWWSRKPTAACRAVLFASLVDDPSARPEEFPTDDAQRRERERLFRIIERLVKWENVNDELVLEEARQEILKSTDGNPPPVLDPFCGGGSIPLEAQRLGLKAYASDLNPVAVLITKALIEIPPRFAGRPPVNPEYRHLSPDTRALQENQWHGAKGLAEDVRYYGKWIREEAEKRIGHLYPKVQLPREHGGGKAMVIAWLWARTVKCPNPACGAVMPLTSKFWLSAKAEKKAWVEPIVDKAAKSVRFEVKTGKGMPPDGTVNRRGARCIVCGQAVPFDHIRAEGKAGRMHAQLMAIAAEGEGGRTYLAPSGEHTTVSAKAQPSWWPETDLPHNSRDFKTPNYGMTRHCDLFTPRQLVALTTFSDLAADACKLAEKHAAEAGLPDDGVPLSAGGTGGKAYSEALLTYLAFALDKCADYWNTIATWAHSGEFIHHCFSRQAIPMTWDFAECNPFSNSTANWGAAIEWVSRAIEMVPSAVQGTALQLDASSSLADVQLPLVCTDPPYYDNVGYADLSDFFYVWLRRNVGRVYPTLFNTLLTPKSEELVATPYRFGGDRRKAEEHFLAGLRKAFCLMRENAHSDYPITIYYAFKQQEEDDDGSDTKAIASTGWETMLEGLLAAGFQVVGTYPMRTERTGRTIEIGTNALASSIVLVCRPRPKDASMATRREFVAQMRRELPEALRKLQQGNVAPVDFAQAAIGPGMAVFSRYSKVLEPDGSAMPVRTALQLINQELDAFFAQQEGDLDPDTRFCVAWFEQYGTKAGLFGDADVLARAKNTSVEGLVRAGLVEAREGAVRLLNRNEYPDDWNPVQDSRLSVWKCTHHLIHQLERRGEEGAAGLAGQLGAGRSEEARALAYRLFAICERKGWSQDALGYNILVTSWRDVQTRTRSLPSTETQEKLAL